MDHSILKGKKILVTRQREQSGEFIRELEQTGASVIIFPTIRIADPENWEDCDMAIKNIRDFDVLVFTSSNAVERFFQRLSGSDNKLPDCIKIYAIGPATLGKIYEFNHPAELVNGEFSGKSLADALMNRLDKNTHVLFPHGNTGRHELGPRLRKFGFRVKEVIVYRNIEAEQTDINNMKTYIRNNFIDVFTFFSPSSIKNLLTHIPVELVNGSVVAVIGNTTAEFAVSQGLDVRIVPREATSKELARSIVSYFKKLKRETINI